MLASTFRVSYSLEWSCFERSSGALVTVWRCPWREVGEDNGCVVVQERIMVVGGSGEDNGCVVAQERIMVVGGSGEDNGCVVAQERIMVVWWLRRG